MTLIWRIGELEKPTRAGKKVVIWVHYNGDDAELTDVREEAPIADYKSKNPDRKEEDSIVLNWKDGQFQERL